MSSLRGWNTSTCVRCGCQLVTDREFDRSVCDPCSCDPAGLRASSDEAEDRAAADILRMEPRS